MIGKNTSEITDEIYSNADATGSCAIGYQGIFCEACQKFYTKSSNKRCVQCGDIREICLFFGKLLIRLIIYFYMVYKAFDLGKSLMKKNIEPNIVILNFLIKLFVGHFQFIRLLVVIFPIENISIVRQIISFLSSSIVFDSDPSFGLDCLGLDKKIRIKYLNIIVKLLIPIITPLVFKMIKGIRKILTKAKDSLNKATKNSKNKKRRKVSTISDTIFEYSSSFSTLSICTMIMFDPIILSLMENFHYINIGDEQNVDYRIVSDLELQYDKNGFNFFFYFLLISLILIGGLLPFFIFVNIRQYSLSKDLGLENPVALFKYGYFYYAYNRKLYYYEIFYIGRKLLLISIEVFFARKFIINNQQPLTFLLILLGFFLVTSYFSFKFKPFNRQQYDVLNRLEFTSLIIQTLSCAIACFSLSLDSNDSLVFSFKIIMATPNILFSLAWLVYFWNSLKSSKTFKKARFVFLKKILNKTFKSFTDKSGEQPKNLKGIDEEKLSYLEKINKLTLLSNLLIQHINYLEESMNMIGEEVSISKPPNNTINKQLTGRSQQILNSAFSVDNSKNMSKLTASESKKSVPSDSAFEVELVKKQIEGEHFEDHLVVYKYKIPENNVTEIKIKDFDSAEWNVTSCFDWQNSFFYIGLRQSLRVHCPSFRSLNFLLVGKQSAEQRAELVANIKLNFDIKTVFKNISISKWNRFTEKEDFLLTPIIEFLSLKVAKHIFKSPFKDEVCLQSFLQLSSPFISNEPKKLTVMAYKDGKIKIYGKLMKNFKNILINGFEEILIKK